MQVLLYQAGDDASFIISEIKGRSVDFSKIEVFHLDD